MSKSFRKGRNGRDGSRQQKEQLSLSKREAMKKRGDKEKHLSTVQKNIENAAKKIQHRTHEQKKRVENPRKCELARKSGHKVHGKNQVKLVFLGIRMQPRPQGSEVTEQWH